MQLTDEEREALEPVVAEWWESGDSNDMESVATLIRAALKAVPRLASSADAAPGAEREAGRPFVARHSACSEEDADEVAQKLFGHYGDEALVEVCRKLTSDPNDEQVWSVLCTRWPAPAPTEGREP